MSYLIALIVTATLLVAVIVIASRYLPPKCQECRDGLKIEHLPEFGVFGTALCIHCQSCGNYYVLEATSREVKTIDAATAHQDYRKRKES